MQFIYENQKFILLLDSVMPETKNNPKAAKTNSKSNYKSISRPLSSNFRAWNERLS